MQILPTEPNFGQSFGASLGQGLGAGLQALASAKMDQVNRNQVYNYLKNTNPNMPEAQARAISHLPADMRGEALKYEQQGQANQAMGQYLSAMAGYPQQPQQQYQQQTPSAGMQNIQAMQQPQKQQIPQMHVPGQQTVQAQPSMQAAAQKQATMQQQAQIPGQMPQQQGVPPIDFRHVPVQQQMQLAGLGMKSKAEQRKAAEFERNFALKEELGGRRAATMEKRQEEMAKYHGKKLGLEEYKTEEGIKKASFKETAKAREEIVSDAKSAKENEMRLERIKELDKKGNIQNPILYSALNKIGLDIPALKNADSQELEKLSNDFLKSAKNVFGSRLTNFDVETFFKTVPTLSQTKAGRSRVIRNLQLFNKGPLLREQTMRDILKENKNIPPKDLMEQVSERMAPKLDKIAEQFKSGAGSESEFSVGQKLVSLPEPKSLPVGTEIRKKDGTMLRNTGTGWQRI